MQALTRVRLSNCVGLALLQSHTQQAGALDTTTRNAIDNMWHARNALAAKLDRYEFSDHRAEHSDPDPGTGDGAQNGVARPGHVWSVAVAGDVIVSGSADHAVRTLKLCDNNGTRSSTHRTCTCPSDDFAGEICQLSRAETCSGRGRPADDGACHRCDKGHAGSRCQFSRAVTCTGHGDPDEYGSCKRCDVERAGLRCQYSRDKTCSGAGTPNQRGGCARCDDGWAGPQCQYSADTHCSGHVQ